MSALLLFPGPPSLTGRALLSWTSSAQAIHSVAPKRAARSTSTSAPAGQERQQTLHRSSARPRGAMPDSRRPPRHGSTRPTRSSWRSASSATARGSGRPVTRCMTSAMSATVAGSRQHSQTSAAVWLSEWIASDVVSNTAADPSGNRSTRNRSDSGRRKCVSGIVFPPSRQDRCCSTARAHVRAGRERPQHPEGVPVPDARGDLRRTGRFRRTAAATAPFVWAWLAERRASTRKRDGCKRWQHCALEIEGSTRCCPSPVQPGDRSRRALRGSRSRQSRARGRCRGRGAGLHRRSLCARARQPISGHDGVAMASYRRTRAGMPASSSIFVT